MPKMTPDQIVEFLQNKDLLEKYLSNIPGLDEKNIRDIGYEYKEEEYAKTVIRERLKRKGYYDKGFDVALEINLHTKNNRVLYLGGEEEVEFSEAADVPELQEKMKKGKLCVSIDDQGELQLYQHGTYEFQMGFYGGEPFDISFTGMRKVPKEEHAKYLQEYGFLKEEVVQLLHEKHRDMVKPGHIEQVRKNVREEVQQKVQQEDLKNNLDNLWEVVHGASLWWKNSGNYTDMHNKLKEIKKYVEKNGNSTVQNDPEFAKMMQDMTQSTVAYLQSKNPSEMAQGSNADRRYKAALEVLKKFGSPEQKLEFGIGEKNEQKPQEIEAEEPQAKAEEPQAKAEEAQAEAEEAQAEAEEAQAEAEELQAKAEDSKNPMPNHEDTTGDIDWILWHLKEKKILNQEVTPMDLAMGVILSADKDKEPCKKMLIQLKEVKEKELTEDVKELLQNNVGKWVEKRKDAAEKQEKKQKEEERQDGKKYVLKIKIGIQKLNYFNQILNEAGSEDKYWRVGANILEGVRADQNNMFQMKGSSKDSDEQKMEKQKTERKIHVDSKLLMAENSFFKNAASKISISYSLKNDQMIKKTDLPLYATAVLMKNDRDNRISNEANGQDNRGKKMDKLNVLYCLKQDGDNQFAENIYENVIKNYIKLDLIKDDGNKYRYERNGIEKILEKNKNELDKKLQDYCQKRVEAMKKEAANGKSNEVKELSDKNEKVKEPEKTDKQTMKAQGSVM